MGDGPRLVAARNEEGRSDVTPERWQEVKTILAGALERQPQERALYLDQACTEPALRREVQSLIEAHEQAETTFMGQPFVGTTETLKSGTKLGPYEILASIGAGGMGVVYRARDERLERDVAIKVLPLGLLTDGAARKRFRKEALALARLNHTNIATVHDVGEQNGTDYLVMECVAGQTLAEEVKSGSLTEKDAVALGVQIAAALEEAHEQSVVHRDLKPANIMVTPKRQVKVLDFGLARILRTVGDFSGTATESLTQNQNIAGTLAYMAPEQLRGERADARTDIHAVGTVLFETVTGKRPYHEDSVPQLTDAILHQQPVAPRALNARVSPELERIVLKCLEKEPESRYQSAKELGVDLRRLSAPSTVTAAPSPPSKSRRLRFLLAGTGILATALVITLAANIGGIRDRLFHATPATRIRSIAVLPLENLSRDPEQEYFADGITDELITDLAQIGALRVISRTSAMRYKQTKKSMPEIAKELNVDGVVEGSVQRVGNRVRVAAQLIDGPTDQHVWAKSYERDATDILTLQQELARAIADEIQVNVTPQEQTRLTSARQVNPEAYNALLKANYLLDNQRSVENARRAVEYSQQALRIDPNYTPAYVSLADSYESIASLGGSTLDEEEPKAKAAVEKAEQLDETLGKAHAVRAALLGSFDLDWSGAGKELRRAIELNPSDSGDRLAYAWYLGLIGRTEEAIAEGQRAQQLDPLSFLAARNLGVFFYWARRYDEALKALQQARDLNPDSPVLYNWFAAVYNKKGMRDESVDMDSKDMLANGAKPETVSALKKIYKVSGWGSYWEKGLELARQDTGPHSRDAFWTAKICARLERKDDTLYWLNKSDHDRRSPNPDAMINVDPEFDFLRSNPRFQQLLRRMNFSQ
jgi:serine/threonine protein kinase/tetratricopeptide (TPR) repeat protein